MDKKIIKIIIFALFCFPIYANKDSVLLKQQVTALLPRIEGWCSREKAQNFIDLVLETKPKVCVEIGVFGGASLVPVASALKFLGQGLIIGIDPWDRTECIRYYDPVKDKANFDWWNSVNLQNVYYSFINVLIRFGLEAHVQTIRATAEKAVSQIDTIDILHWDGNHNEIAATQDIKLYLPKVRSGGYIWINDALWPEIQPALDLLLSSCDVVKLIDNGNCILFRKR